MHLIKLKNRFHFIDRKMHYATRHLKRSRALPGGSQGQGGHGG